MVERMSAKRQALLDIKGILEGLNSVPHEKRKHLGSFAHYVRYDYFIGVMDQEIAKLERDRARSKLKSQEDRLRARGLI